MDIPTIDAFRRLPLLLQGLQAKRIATPEPVKMKRPTLGQHGILAKQAALEDDPAAEFFALADSFASFFRLSPERAALALATLFEGVRALSADGANIAFAVGGVEKDNAVLSTTNGPSVEFTVFSGAGYVVDSIIVGVDGLGGNDVVNAVVKMTGRDPIPWEEIVGNGPCEIPVGGVLTSAIKVKVSSPTASDDNPVGVLIKARGRMATPEELHGFIARQFPNAPERRHRLVTGTAFGHGFDALAAVVRK
jgi:hypothetical protein